MGIAAIQSSQVLSQLSTVRNAGGLICRVRNGSGSFPAAMAAIPIYIMVDSLFIKVLLRSPRKNRKPFYIEWHIIAYQVSHYFTSIFTRFRSMCAQLGVGRCTAPRWSSARCYHPIPQNSRALPIDELNGRYNKTDKGPDTATSEYLRRRLWTS
jgi:hypothetical protein